MSKQSTGLFLCRFLPRFTSAFTSISGSNPTDYIKIKTNHKSDWFLFGGDGGNRSARFCARRHAAPKNSPPDCFLNGCFDYIPQQKYKSTTRVLLIFGGDGGNRNRVQNRLTKGSTSVFYLLGYPLTYRR